MGAEADSYFEYLLKYWILTGKQVRGIFLILCVVFVSATLHRFSRVGLQPHLTSKRVHSLEERGC